jgi:hypothetical protein
MRRAVVLAGLGDRSVPVIGELARDALETLEAAAPGSEADAEHDDEPSPILRLLGDNLLCSVPGLEVACDLIGGVPEVVGVLALAASPASARDVGVLAPPDARTLLARVSLEIATEHADSELGTLALFLLARMSAGDETIAEVIADALTGTQGQAANLLTALGELRVTSEHTAAALAPMLGPESPIGARVAATAVSGRVLPPEHAAWAHVRELLELGTIARAAAWAALRDRARRRIAGTYSIT